MNFEIFRNFGIMDFEKFEFWKNFMLTELGFII